VAARVSSSATSSRLVCAASAASWACLSAVSASSLRAATRCVTASWRALRLASRARSASAAARADSCMPEAISMVEARLLRSSTESEAST